MDWLIPALIGWCGTGWPRHFPGTGPVGPGDGDPWPPNCPMCGGVIGALSAVVINVLCSAQLATLGFIPMAITMFAAGSVGNSLVGGIVGRLRGK